MSIYIVNYYTNKMPLPLTSIIFITDSRCIPFETKEDIDITSAAIGEWA